MNQTQNVSCMNTDEAVNRLALKRFIQWHDLANSAVFAANASFTVGEGKDHVHQYVQVDIIREADGTYLRLDQSLSSYGETVPYSFHPTRHLIRLHKQDKLIVGHVNGPESDFIVWLTPTTKKAAGDHSINHGFWSWVKREYCITFQSIF